MSEPQDRDRFLEVEKIEKELPKGFRLKWIPAEIGLPADVIWATGGPQDLELLQKKVRRFLFSSWETVGHINSCFGLLMDASIFLHKDTDPELLPLFKEIAAKLHIELRVV